MNDKNAPTLAPPRKFIFQSMITSLFTANTGARVMKNYTFNCKMIKQYPFLTIIERRLNYGLAAGALGTK
jgi:hypothetical protein